MITGGISNALVSDSEGKLLLYERLINSFRKPVRKHCSLFWGDIWFPNGLWFTESLLHVINNQGLLKFSHWLKFFSFISLFLKPILSGFCGWVPRNLFTWLLAKSSKWGINKVALLDSKTNPPGEFSVKQTTPWNGVTMLIITLEWQRGNVMD